MALFDEDDDDDEHHHHQDHLLMLPSLFTGEDEDDLLMDLTPQESSWSLELLEAVTATPHVDTAAQQLSYHNFSQHQISSNHDYLAAERLNSGQMSQRIPTTGQQLLPSTAPSSTTPSSAPSTRSQRRPTSRNAARERSRVQSLRTAFLQLQNSLPAVPPNTKLSKLDVLVLATTYISHLMQILDESNQRASEAAAHSHACLDDTETIEPGSNDPGTGVHQHRLGEKGYLHPVRKWPMRSRLYAGAFNESQNRKSPKGRTAFNPDNHLSLQEVDFPFQLS